MNKRIWKRFAAILLTACLLSGCGLPELKDMFRMEEDSDRFQAEDDDTGEENETVENTSEEISGEVFVAAKSSRPALLNRDAVKEIDTASPAVLPYAVEPDLSNIDNLWQVYLNDEMAEKLVKNGFVVSGNAGAEFFEQYEWNRYSLVPSFVTVDSLMHTYHLYFSYLMKNIEKDHLSDALADLSARMAENSAAQYELLRGTEWEDAAARNVAFFTVGAKLLDTDVPDCGYAEDMVSRELDAINSASGIADCAITGKEEDYTQYIPRGYYEGDEQLEHYFKAMMWYGRIHFEQKEEELDRSALLITLALTEDAESYGLWEKIYAVTSFFAGASDDAGVCEYAPLMEEAYGGSISVKDLAKDQEAFDRFRAMTASLVPPQINSVPIQDGESNVIPGFRFMGQRFTIDAAVMQQLIYQNVSENGAGERRMLPDVLDVPAALGSGTALQILNDQGDTAYGGYSEHMEKLRTGLAAADQTLWTASLYANWLNTLRPLLDEKGDGYPFFMQNEEWAKKNLECFAGSFTELKHDTVLYTKQIMAEMGGGMEEEPDDRGYVEPEPLVYGRFKNLASLTAEGLKGYGMLDSAEGENLMKLSEMAEKLLTIANKELQEEALSDEEYEFIRSYGGNLEHFWIEAVKNDTGVEAAQELPAAVVVDIATDPNGQVLEAATGNPSAIYVAVKMDGRVKIAKGSVYTFYQFPWPMDDRLTDSKWRYLMGYQADENGNWNYDGEPPVKQPEWTQSYRY
jgi:hypothetical protein